MNKSIQRMLGLTGKALAIYVAIEVTATIIAVLAGLAYVIFKMVRHH